MAELNTAVKYGMNITHILINNGELGKISKEQRAANWDVWQTSLHNPNFAEYANLCGARGIRVTEVEQLDDALGGALAHDGVSLVEVIADAELIRDLLAGDDGLTAAGQQTRRAVEATALGSIGALDGPVGRNYQVVGAT